MNHEDHESSEKLEGDIDVDDGLVVEVSGFVLDVGGDVDDVATEGREDDGAEVSNESLFQQRIVKANVS